MKTNTLKQKSRTFPSSGGMLLMALLGFASLKAQVHNGGTLYIGDGGEVYLGGGTYAFAAGGSTQTTLGSSYGVLSFGNGASQSGASGAHFIKGYCRVYGVAAKILPVGAGAVYAPVMVSPSSANTGGVAAAYVAADPSTIGTSTDGTVTAVSGIEYWVFKGSSPSKLSLSWRSSSGLNGLTGSALANLTLAGWNGTNWVVLPSTVDVSSFVDGEASTLLAGSITTDTDIVPNTYAAYTFATKEGACDALIASSGITKTWSNGSWSPSAPTLEDPAVIETAFAGSLSCNSLVLNADITLTGNEYVEIVNGASGTGKIKMATNTSLVQRNPTAVAPKVELTKVTRDMRRFDYIYLSAPLDVANFGVNINDAATAAVNGSFSTQTLGPFSNYKTLAPNGDQVTITSFTKGQGFRALVRNQAPYATSSTSGSWDDDKKPIHIKTTGVAHNGDVNFTVQPNKWLFLGNPYPSAIDGGKLLKAAGANVRQTLYYWTFNTPMSSTYTYNTNDFATWTSVGGVATCASCPTPDGSIASMQAVQIKSNSTTTAASFSVTNCMRKKEGNTVFFRSAQSAEADRFWLNLNGSGGSFSQILLAYVEGAKTSFDEGLDGERNIMQASTRISSMVDGTEYAVQARPSFDDNDAVPLFISQVNNEMLTISLGNKEGVFASGQDIFLHDKVLDAYHNLTGGSFTFTPDVAYSNDRYEVVYRNSTLSNPDFDSHNVVAGIRNEQLNVSASLGIDKVQVFDMTGRLIATYGSTGEKTFSHAFPHAEGVYIAKIYLDNNLVSSKKVINRR